MLIDSHNDLLKSVSRSFYLSLRFLPGAMREPVSLGYLLARFTDTIADAPGLDSCRRLDLLDQTRLIIQGECQNYDLELKDVAAVLTHDGERRLVERSRELFEWYREIDSENRDHLSEVILTIIHGQAWDATCFESDSPVACESADELLRYTYWVAGCVGEFWTKVGFTTLGEKFADPDSASLMLVNGRKLGQALQLINILRDIHEDLRNGRCYLPSSELREAGWDGKSAPTAKVMAPAFDKWIGVCQEYLEEADHYIEEVRDFRVRFCTRLPKLLAAETACALSEAGIDQVMLHRIKVPRSQVWKSMARAALF